MPDALRQDRHLYLMTDSQLTPRLVCCYPEQENLSVKFNSIYPMPNPYKVPGYDGINIYKVRVAR